MCEKLIFLAVIAAVGIQANEYSWPPRASIPAGMIMAWAGACPSGWSEYTAARGRYVVGVPVGGTIEAAIGTVLSNQENREVAQHRHNLVVESHTHSGGTFHHHHGHLNASATGGTVGGSIPSAGGVLTTGSTPMMADGLSSYPSSISVTIHAYGSTSGTTAPYIQLRLCRKN